MTAWVQRIGGIALPCGNSSVQRQTCPSATVSIQLTDIRSNNDHTKLWNIRECSSYTSLRMVPLNYWANNEFVQRRATFPTWSGLTICNQYQCVPPTIIAQDACIWHTHVNFKTLYLEYGFLGCDTVKFGTYIHAYQYLRGIYIYHGTSLIPEHSSLREKSTTKSSVCFISVYKLNQSVCLKKFM
jgi:hypothetical protein